MANLTKAQRRMVKRALTAADAQSDQSLSLRSKHNRADSVYRHLASKYQQPYHGCTKLTGSGDFRVARALQEMGAGREASLPGTEFYYFVLRNLDFS